jgi:tryptophanyl-tRNA synthetase
VLQIRVRQKQQQKDLKQADQVSREAPPAIKPAADAQTHGQVVTPWDVQGSVSEDGKQLAIDYEKLVDQFGTRRIDAALLERFERLTGHKPHVLLRRGMFFSHR